MVISIKNPEVGRMIVDSLTYAVARLTEKPLLFVGDDLGATDLEAA